MNPFPIPLLVIHDTLGHRNSTSISGLSNSVVVLPSVNRNLLILGAKRSARIPITELKPS